MRLRTKLVTLSLLTLLLPWSGWKLLQELEQFLREAQEGALLASARSLAAAMPLEFRSRLLFLPDRYLPVRPLPRPPALDGYSDDWPDADHGLEFRSVDGLLSVRFLAGEHDGRLYLLFDVGDAERAHAAPPGLPDSADGLILLARNPRGLFSYTISPEAPGPLQLSSERGGPGQLEGFWQERQGGYRLELALPASAANTDVSFQVRDAGVAAAGPVRLAGPMSDPGRPVWVALATEWQGLSEWFSRSEIGDARTLLLDARGWVLADSGAEPQTGAEPGVQRTTWLQRLLYRLVAGSRTELLDETPSDPVHLGDVAARRALAGEEAVNWTQDMETAVVWSTVAVPLILEDEIHGAIVMQSSSDGLLLVTNRALGRLLFTTLALTLGLAAGLWYFATRLSQRVQRLSGAVSSAMEDTTQPGSLPLQADRDELGDLARNNQKLLQAVADYSSYLQSLASKLSHELKTPLAITRSSLDNLASREIDDETRLFLERAREGVDRQTAIVRAMSEASRLEAAIGSAEWETVDLAGLVRRCAEGYCAVHGGRNLSVELPGDAVETRCAPELLAQALDKLVDNAMSLSGPEDEVTIELRLIEGGRELAVRNTGSRLPEALRDRLFDSLVSVRDRPGAAPHLGLGLYIVRLVAAAHGGRASARNLADGAGVEFTIAIPV